jgi:hypothetical protein
LKTESVRFRLTVATLGVMFFVQATALGGVK